MKTQEELNELKAEVETLNKKLKELTGEELNQVTGGITEQELIEIAKKTQIDISKNDKNKLIEDMEQIIELSNKILGVEN